MKRLTNGGGYIAMLRAARTGTGGAPVALDTATATATAVRGDAPDPARQSIVDWMTRLALLYGVPFSYLVPDPRQFPAESLRVFKVDPNWVLALLDGAFSIGRGTQGAVEGTVRSTFDGHDATLLQRARTGASQHITTPRLRRLGRAVPVRAAAAPDGPQELGAVTGLVLRSAVVSGWPAMEIKAYADEAKTQPLDALRIDRVAPDMLIALFRGTLARVTFSEPAETLHFGVAMPDAAGHYAKNLRAIVPTTAGGQPGEQLFDGDVPVSARVPFRDGGRRVVDAKALAETIRTTLVGKKALGPDAPFTSAEFGLELVQGVQEVDVIVS